MTCVYGFTSGNKLEKKKKKKRNTLKVVRKIGCKL